VTDGRTELQWLRRSARKNSWPKPFHPNFRLAV